MYCYLYLLSQEKFSLATGCTRVDLGVATPRCMSMAFQERGESDGSSGNSTSSPTSPFGVPLPVQGAIGIASVLDHQARYLWVAVPNFFTRSANFVPSDPSCVIAAI